MSGLLWFLTGCAVGYGTGWLLAYAISVFESIEEGANPDTEPDEGNQP